MPPRSPAHNPGELIGLERRLRDLAWRYRGLDELARALDEVAAVLRAYLAAIGHDPESESRRRI